MPSPHVAGDLALMTSVHPTWAPAKLIRQLRLEADGHACTAPSGGPRCVGTAADNRYYGEGLVEALDAAH